MIRYVLAIICLSACIEAPESTDPKEVCIKGIVYYSFPAYVARTYAPKIVSDGSEEAKFQACRVEDER